MKYVGSLFSKLAAYGVSLTVTSLVISTQAQPQQGSARVQAIRGTAQYMEAGGSWAKLSVGKTLYGGATIKTAVNSQVDLFLKQNGPVVRVTADTTLALDKLLFEEPAGQDAVIETQLNLSNGRILGNVKKLAATSKYDVKIPTGTVGIRGTEYDISANGKVSIDQGSAVMNQNGVPGQTMINQGQTFNPSTTPGQPATVANMPPGEAIAFQNEFNGNGGVNKIDITIPMPGKADVEPKKPKGSNTDSDNTVPINPNPKKAIGATATVVVGTPVNGQVTVTVINPDGTQVVTIVPVGGTTTNPTITIPGIVGAIPLPKPGVGITIGLPTDDHGEPIEVTKVHP